MNVKDDTALSQSPGSGNPPPTFFFCLELQLLPVLLVWTFRKGQDRKACSQAAQGDIKTVVGEAEEGCF